MENFRGTMVRELKKIRPSFLGRNPHFNFLSAHYFWIIGLSLLGSVILFGSGSGNLAYIDALFFATGANTQAGLNTVDVNKLNTFQQITIFLLSMMSNPIAVNSFVVFLRLYWFEKRFQDVVKMALQRRGTNAKSKTKANLEEKDTEKGVNGRNITVMHNGTKSRITNDGIVLDGAARKDKDQPGGDDANGSGHEARRHPEIKFADTVKRSDGLGEDAIKLPPSRSDAEHIAILQRQRKIDDEVLRIPGPRDAERGIRPEVIERGSDEEPEPPTPRVDLNMTLPSNGHIKIEEPDRMKMHDTVKDEVFDDAVAATHACWCLKIPHFRKPHGHEHHHHDDNKDLHKTFSRRPSLHTVRTAFSRDKTEGTPYLSWEPTIGRNSAFPDLDEDQREELGGIEYRSLKTLALILFCYFWGFWFFGVACLTPWIQNINRWGVIVDAAAQNRTWWGFFTANSAFMDLGLTLTPDSMNSFNTAVLPLLIMSFLIILGNTGFPIMLRFIIWVLSLIVPRATGIYEELRFLLDHPRRCFTLLFPSGATWWLFWLLVILNGLDVMFFIVLDLGSGPVAEMPAGIKVLNGFFEAASTRTAGFSCINLALLHPGVQVSYMIMMYISVFPIAISVRRTNVYEEKSLGIYSNNDVDDQTNGSDLSYVGAHLRRQLSFDLWYIFVGFFILAITEGPKIMEERFTMFAILFEIVSAYGTVGMSLGYPDGNESLVSQFSVIGKLVIIAMMIRGRHRGLPYGLDRAILLPSEGLHATEAADASARIARQNSHVSTATGVDSGHLGGPAGGKVGGGLRRHMRSLSMDVGPNILTSLLHPGPARPAEMLSAGFTTGLHRKNTNQTTDGVHHHSSPFDEDGPSNIFTTPFASRVTKRRSEASFAHPQQPAPRTSFSHQPPPPSQAHRGTAPGEREDAAEVRSVTFRDN